MEYVEDEVLESIPGMEGMLMGYLLARDREHAAELMQEVITGFMASEIISKRAKLFAWSILKPTLDRENPSPLWPTSKRGRGVGIQTPQMLARRDAAIRARKYYLRRKDSGKGVTMPEAIEITQNYLASKGVVVDVEYAWNDLRRKHTSKVIDEKIRTEDPAWATLAEYREKK